MSKSEMIIDKWKNGTKQVDIAKEFSVTEAYISQILAPEKRKKKIMLEIEKRPIEIIPKREKKLPTLEFNGMVQSLIIALTYAINTVKNKKQVKAKDVNSTWFQHYKSWSRIREYFQKLEDEK